MRRVNPCDIIRDHPQYQDLVRDKVLDSIFTDNKYEFFVIDEDMDDSEVQVGVYKNVIELIILRLQ